jgi:hypothetical protein
MKVICLLRPSDAADMDIRVEMHDDFPDEWIRITGIKDDVVCCIALDKCGVERLIDALKLIQSAQSKIPPF